MLCGCLDRLAGRNALPDMSPPAPVTTPPPLTHVELMAEARGNAVVITVINHSPKTVRVGPETFGVIVGSKIHPGNSSGVIAQFPRRALKHKQWAAGMLRFPKLGSLEGHALVLNTPDAPRQITTIKPYDPKREITYRRSFEELSRREKKRLARERKRRLEELKRLLVEKSREPR
jgi:hypothetical protein